ncbi:MAG TPA: hypothetical protein VN677_13400 [Gemmatimonadaceae bacterium]|nr:hypothetical protein [Gemmatimonadaceae bacterium]
MGMWVSPGKDYADTRYSTLEKITTANVGKLKEVWSYTTGIQDGHEGQPLVVNGKVIVGDSGGEMAVWGWAQGLDLKTGRVLWRARNTGPDRDVLIGSSFKPFYPWMQGKDLGVTSWRGQQWKIGGSASRGWVSYNPELNLIYFGTSNPGVWNPDMRPGDNLWSTTIWARDPDTGQARWNTRWRLQGSECDDRQRAPEDALRIGRRAALGVVGAVPDLPSVTKPGGMLHVFAIQ